MKTKPLQQDDLERLAKEHGVILTQLPVEISKEMRLCNKMMCFDEVITMGTFNDPMLRSAIFYHELAHIELGMARACTYIEEREVWRAAFRNMRRFGFLPPYSVLKKCIQQLYEYRNVSSKPKST